jgi:prophage maintenance system killer protein
MEVVMVLNGLELMVSVNEAEAAVLKVATGSLDRDGLAQWLAQHQSPLGSA